MKITIVQGYCDILKHSNQCSFLTVLITEATPGSSNHNVDIIKRSTDKMWP